MKKLLFIACLLLLAMPTLADSVDEAEAKRRGVAVEVVQLENAKARIAALEKQVADLKLQLAGKGAPTQSSSTSNISLKKTRKDLPAPVQTYLASRDESYRAEISSLKYTITEDSRPIPANVEYDSPADRAADQQKKRNAILAATKRLQQIMKDGPGLYIPGFYIHYADVGTGGHIADVVKVVQVIDKSSAIIEQGGTQVLIKGFDFSKIADDSTIAVPSCVLANGTTSFSTVLNAKRTLLELDVFDPLDYKDY